jgi:activating signal cointegrator complex subunit 1
MAQTAMAGAKHNAPKQQGRHQLREKRPPLTHFLCLPLVNSASLPQLESSLAAFRAEYPPVPVAKLPDASNKQDASHAIIPEGAVRPLGTLHLTLGVMSLPTKERLCEALQFFQSLDLASLMREAERVAAELREKDKSRVRSSTPDKGSGDITTQAAEPETLRASDPLYVTLESLHCLPRAKAATVLHTFPVDRTGRLYPFCLMLRDKFIQAGFLQGETKDKQKNEKKDDQDGQSRAESDLAPKSSDPYTAALTRKPKPRPLLLHATVVNTIYVRGRPNRQPNATSSKREKNKPRRIEFDARDLLARYRDYYVDEARTVPRAEPTTRAEGSETAEDEVDRGEIISETQEKYPFVWAKDIPIDSVCICEMGAKKLSLDSEDALLNKRLGEMYTVIAQRSLDGPQSSLSARPVSAGSDGGVKLS